MSNMKHLTNMKTKFLLLFASLFCLINNLQSQDILVYKNGDEIQSKVIDVADDNIKYKKWGNLDGPSYTASKKDVLMIKYQNGTKDVFNNQPAQTNSNTVASQKKAETGKICFYTSDKRIDQIDIYVYYYDEAGVKKSRVGQLDFYFKSPPDCGQDGTYTLNLPPGDYDYYAVDDIIYEMKGTFSVRENQCSFLDVICR